MAMKIQDMQQLILTKTIHKSSFENEKTSKKIFFSKKNAVTKTNYTFLRHLYFRVCVCGIHRGT